MKVKIEGASDDLLELEGDLCEEFNPSSDTEEQSFLAFGDGTILRVMYDNDGIWRITVMAKGTAKFTKTEGIVSEDTNDVVELDGDLKWALFCHKGQFVTN